MKELVAALIVVGVVTASAFAFTSTWRTPLLGAPDATRGVNERIEVQKANFVELREQMHKIRVFQGYSTQSPAW